jgi:lipoprotein-anchoring transpeptidase ErfK/SrfK
LAAVASPRASLVYLLRALEINPNSQTARRGLRWAIRRNQGSRGRQTAQLKRRLVDASIPSVNLIQPRSTPQPLPWVVAVLLLLTLAFLFLRFISSGGGITTLTRNWWDFNPIALAQQNLSKATRTPTSTSTSLPTATFTSTPTFTPSPTPTDTPTAPPAPTDTPFPTEEPIYIPDSPDVGARERWVDVNLSLQTAYAFRGKKLVRSFVVSTGTWQHPTVTGQFYIYVKYRYADMSGPGYYLPDVPYVMYFYKGYGLHGTYWHNNFGTPMSHGCINFSIEDAGWLFEFADVGTLVNVHY